VDTLENERLHRHRVESFCARIFKLPMILHFYATGNRRPVCANYPVWYNDLYMKEDTQRYQERIIADPRILAGKPVVKGTRISVDLVLEELSHNLDITELLAAHPDLTRTDVQACLAYAKDILAGEEVSPKPPKGTRPDATL
jgi:uncharacterized protein (DUF433 family)